MRKYYKLLIYSIFLGLGVSLINGCARLEWSLTNKAKQVDETLAAPNHIKILNDVSSIAFEWESLSPEARVNGVSGFMVYRLEKPKDKAISEEDLHTLPLDKFTLVGKINDPNVTHFFDKNLKPRTNYYYFFITLGDKDRISNRSQILSAKTSYLDPVEEVFIVPINPNKIKLVITPHTNPSVNGYIIERKNESDKFVKIAELKHRLDIEYFDTGLKSGAEYSYRVIAKDFYGNLSSKNKVINITTLELLPKVSNVKASTDLPFVIKLSWDEIEDAKAYRIYAKNTEGNFELIAQSKNPTYKHKIAESGKKMTYQIVGLDKYNLEGKKLPTPIEGQTLAPPSAPNIIENNIVKKGANTYIHIAWETPNNERAKTFILYRKDSKSGRTNEYRNLKTMQFDDREIEAGVSYTYSVTCVDEFGIISLPSASINLNP